MTERINAALIGSGNIGTHLLIKALRSPRIKPVWMVGIEQALLMESYGANCIHCTDSAGYMLADDVTARIALLRARLEPATELGIHGHHNLAMGIANSLAAVEAGANRIDGSATRLRAGGWSLWLDSKRRAAYTYNYFSQSVNSLVDPHALPDGKSTLEVQMNDSNFLSGGPAESKLSVNCKVVGKLQIPHTTPCLFSVHESFDVGKDSGSPVADYAADAAFDGTITPVRVAIH